MMMMTIQNSREYPPPPRRGSVSIHFSLTPFVRFSPAGLSPSLMRLRHFDLSRVSSSQFQDQRSNLESKWSSENNMGRISVRSFLKWPSEKWKEYKDNLLPFLFKILFFEGITDRVSVEISSCFSSTREADSL